MIRLLIFIYFMIIPNTYALAEWSGSVMFSPQDYNSIKAALEFYKKAITQQSPPTKSNESIPIPAAESGPSLAIPSFYLNSIIYNNPNDWVIWLNNTKYISTEKNFHNLEVMYINKFKITLAYNITSLDNISLNWKSQLIATEDGKFTTKDKNIIYDSSKQIIYFTLSPNQTFNLQELTITEGHKEDHYSKSSKEGAK